MVILNNISQDYCFTVFLTE